VFRKNLLGRKDKAIDPEHEEQQQMRHSCNIANQNRRTNKRTGHSTQRRNVRCYQWRATSESRHRLSDLL